MKSGIVSRAILILFLLQSTVDASEFEDCNTDGQDKNSCARIVACIGEGVDHFVGKAIGFESGRLGGELQDGTACIGEWSSRSMFGLGVAHIVCENGVTSDVVFNYQHPQSGTATGIGQTSNGYSVKIWAGNHIKQFLSALTGEVEPSLFCGTTEIPLS